jgi:arginine decarboxylase
LPVNKWDNEYSRVNIGGISCDHSDYYNSEDLKSGDITFLPMILIKKNHFILDFSIQAHIRMQYQWIWWYQSTALSHRRSQVIIDRDDKGNIVDRLYRDEQTVEQMLKILGY